MPDIGDILVDNQLDRMLALDQALSASGIPYAFGGAIALDYYTEPRATSDFDVNIFCGDDAAAPVWERLSAIGVPVTDEGRAIAAQDGQVRLPWGAYKLDLFFSTTAFHDAMVERVTRTSGCLQGDLQPSEGLGGHRRSPR